MSVWLRSKIIAAFFGRQNKGIEYSSQSYCKDAGYDLNLPEPGVEKIRKLSRSIVEKISDLAQLSNEDPYVSAHNLHACTVKSDLDDMAKLLIDEDISWRRASDFRNKNVDKSKEINDLNYDKYTLDSEDISCRPCLEYFLEARVIEVLCTLCYNDKPEGSLALVLETLAILLNGIKSVPLLSFHHFRLPMCEAIYSGSLFNAPIWQSDTATGSISGLQSGLSQLLSALWFNLKNNPGHIQHFLHVRKDDGVYEFNEFEALFPLLDLSCQSGALARETLLLAISINHMKFQNFILEHSSLKEQLLEKLINGFADILNAYSELYEKINTATHSAVSLSAHNCRGKKERRNSVITEKKAKKNAYNFRIARRHTDFAISTANTFQSDVSVLSSSMGSTVASVKELNASNSAIKMSIEDFFRYLRFCFSIVFVSGGALNKKFASNFCFEFQQNFLSQKLGPLLINGGDRCCSILQIICAQIVSEFQLFDQCFHPFEGLFFVENLLDNISLFDCFVDFLCNSKGNVRRALLWNLESRSSKLALYSLNLFCKIFDVVSKQGATRLLFLVLFGEGDDVSYSQDDEDTDSCETSCLEEKMNFDYFDWLSISANQKASSVRITKEMIQIFCEKFEDSPIHSSCQVDSNSGNYGNCAYRANIVSLHQHQLEGNLPEYSTSDNFIRPKEFLRNYKNESTGVVKIGVNYCVDGDLNDIKSSLPSKLGHLKDESSDYHEPEDDDMNDPQNNKKNQFLNDDTCPIQRPKNQLNDVTIDSNGRLDEAKLNCGIVNDVKHFSNVNRHDLNHEVFKDSELVFNQDDIEVNQRDLGDCKLVIDDKRLNHEIKDELNSSSPKISNSDCFVDSQSILKSGIELKQGSSVNDIKNDHKSNHEVLINSQVDLNGEIGLKRVDLNEGLDCTNSIKICAELNGPLIGPSSIVPPLLDLLENFFENGHDINLLLTKIFSDLALSASTKFHLNCLKSGRGLLVLALFGQEICYFEDEMMKGISTMHQNQSTLQRSMTSVLSTLWGSAQKRLKEIPKWDCFLKDVRIRLDVANKRDKKEMNMFRYNFKSNSNMEFFESYILLEEWLKELKAIFNAPFIVEEDLEQLQLQLDFGSKFYDDNISMSDCSTSSTSSDSEKYFDILEDFEELKDLLKHSEVSFDRNEDIDDSSIVSHRF